MWDWVSFLAGLWAMAVVSYLVETKLKWGFQKEKEWWETLATRTVNEETRNDR
jgi:uncharacterized membrane protein YdcZ (DUF606 family)